MAAIKVFSRDKWESLVAEDEPEADASATAQSNARSLERSAAQTTASGTMGGTAGRSQRSSAEVVAERERWARDMREVEYERQNAANVASMQARSKLEHDQHDLRFQQMMSNYDRGNATFVQDIFEQLDYHEMAETRKKEQLYGEWCEEVFDKIQAQVGGALDLRSSQSIEARKAELMGQFIEATNTKDGLFRDIIIESDYDPLVVREEYLRYSMKGIRDPVKRDIARQMTDRNGIGGKECKGLGKSRSREVLDVKQWHTGKLEATPHGKAAEMWKNRDKPMDAEKAKLYKSKVPGLIPEVNHYNFPRTYQAVQDDMTEKGKRVFAGRPDTLVID